MLKRFSMLLLGLMLVLSMAVLSGCGGSEKTAADKPAGGESKEIKVGIAGPFTGAIAETGTTIKNAVLLDFYCTHLGLDHQERLEQASAILEITSARHRPGILVGDFNDDRFSMAYKMLTSVLRDASGGDYDGGAVFGKVSGFKTYPAGKPQKQLDFVLVTAHWQVNKALAVNSQASDHLAVLAEINLKL